MEISSKAFRSEGPIPAKYTCDGANVSPPLAWSGAPAGTRSFVIMCVDPDAPGGTWHHWAVYDIGASCASLSENVPAEDDSAFRQGINDFGSPGYGGPCPPRGHGAHRYHFRLFAMPVERLRLKAAPSCQAVLRAVNRHALDEATLIGLYER